MLHVTAGRKFGASDLWDSSKHELVATGVAVGSHYGKGVWLGGLQWRGSERARAALARSQAARVVCAADFGGGRSRVGAGVVAH